MSPYRSTVLGEANGAEKLDPVRLSDAVNVVPLFVVLRLVVDEDARSILRWPTFAVPKDTLQELSVEVG